MKEKLNHYKKWTFAEIGFKHGCHFQSADDLELTAILLFIHCLCLTLVNG